MEMRELTNVVWFDLGIIFFTKNADDINNFCVTDCTKTAQKCRSTLNYLSV